MKKVVLVSTNAGVGMGGEAIKAYQYFCFLLENERDAILITHERCRGELEGRLPNEKIIYVPDTLWMVFCWRSKIFSGLVDPLFHLKVARLIRQHFSKDVILHYLCPISPVTPRFAPKGYTHVVGPLSGNIFYPPAFSFRQGRKAVVQQHLYKTIQKLLRFTVDNKSRANKVLVSGYERTREALRWAGIRDDRMIDVADAGISKAIEATPRIQHSGFNGEFVWIGRMIDYKGADIAIHAIAAAEKRIRLTIYGGGEQKDDLVKLASDLCVSDRVNFAGWLDHDLYAEEMSRFRGFVFPTLAEANGIVMQEAMAIGLPVITLNWGGPKGLATASEAIFVEPSSVENVVNEIARSMEQLASAPEFAEKLSVAAYSRAHKEYTWPSVASSWTTAYGDNK